MVYDGEETVIFCGVDELVRDFIDTGWEVAERYGGDGAVDVLCWSHIELRRFSTSSNFHLSRPVAVVLTCQLYCV